MASEPRDRLSSGARSGNVNGVAQRRFGRSLRFAWTGVRLAWRTQPNFRVEVWLGLLALALTLWLRAPLLPILLVSAAVLTLELLNTSIEAVVDLASAEHHALAGAAKDLAAAAVLLAAVVAVLVGLMVLGPPLLQRLGQLFGVST